MPQRVILAVNPTAGSGRGAVVADQAETRLRDAGHLVSRLEARDGEALERVLRSHVSRESPDAVVVVGGDGMVHLAVNAIARSGVPLGILPAGTGNDVSRHLGLPVDDPGAAVDRLLAVLASGRIRTLDAVRTSTGRWFAGMLSAGFDAAVNERANRMRHPRGRARYVVAVLLELARLTPHRYRITIDRDSRQVDAVLVTVGNTSSIGGGMRLTPDAQADDGLLDVLVATPLSRLNLVRLLPKVFTGEHVHDEHVSIERGRVVTIDVADRRAPVPVVYADGERMGGLPVTLEIVPGILRLLA
ncbi:MAG: diacylglycerol/lipid kinase family protein [Amnibacterium sp.]